MRDKVLALFNWRKQFPAQLHWFDELPRYP
jgi:hypothetical protein